MRFLLVVLLGFSSLARAHDYYFAFAEVDYNELTEEMHATVIVSTHDLEYMLRSKGILSKDLASYSDNKEAINTIQFEIQKGFGFRFSGEQKALEFEGMELLLTGNTQFYFSLKQIKSLERVSVKFDFMMDVFAEQQNKMTLIYRNSKTTFVFFTSQKEQELILSKK
jgi:hypothetical protein